MTPGKDTRENLLPMPHLPDEKREGGEHPPPSLPLPLLVKEDNLVMQVTGNSKSILPVTLRIYSNIEKQL